MCRDADIASFDCGGQVVVDIGRRGGEEAAMMMMMMLLRMKMLLSGILSSGWCIVRTILAGEER